MANGWAAVSSKDFPLSEDAVAIPELPATSGISRDRVEGVWDYCQHMIVHAMPGALPVNPDSSRPS
jgi:hypothetical protein